MKLSMWILAESLASFNPEVNITDGNYILRGVRMCSDITNITKSVVYISENAKGQVVLANGHDIISIKHDDPLDIFNIVLDLFEKHYDWETKITEEIHNGCSIDRILEIGHEIIPNYLIVADASFFMRASYGNKEDFEGDENFRISSKDNKLPLEALIAINKQNNIRRENIGPYHVYVPNSNIDTVARNLFANHKHIGWLVALNPDNSFSNGQMQLLDQLGAYAEICQENLMKSENDFSKSSFLLDIVEGKDYNPKFVSEQMSTFGWFESDKKQVYVFSENKESSSHASFDVLFSSFNANTFRMIYHDTFILIVNHSLTDIDLLEKTILNYLRISEGIVGRSSVFTNIFLLKNSVDTARIASQFSKKTGSIVDFSEVTLPYIYALINDYSLTEIRHPALSILAEYDKKHETELYKTLFVFLENERNYTLVAKLLNIHRSTLIYRLERINDLISADLNNPSIRFHLLISFCVSRDGSF